MSKSFSRPSSRPSHLPAVFQAGLAVAVIALLWRFDLQALEFMRTWPGGLRDFFSAFVDVGNSLWSFLYLIPAGLLCLAARRMAKTARRRTQLTRAALVHGFLVLAVAVSGIAVNVLKQMVGRPRPGRGDPTDIAGWQPFAFEPAYTSFPSGHANTLFALAFATAFLRFRPSLLVFAFAFALIGSIARVATENHYPADIVAGALVAYLTTGWLKRTLDRRGYWRWEPNPAPAQG